MDEIPDSEKYAFSEDTVRRRVYAILDDYLRLTPYTESHIPQLTNDICSTVIEELHSAKKPYKYVVHCILQQPLQTQLQLSKSCYWDSVSDGTVTVQYPKKSYKDIGGGKEASNGNGVGDSGASSNAIQAIVTVFAVSYYSTV